MNDLKIKLENICIFRDILNDDVIKSLIKYLEAPSTSSYTEFVSKLYNTSLGDLGKHIENICNKSENIYVKSLASGESIPIFMKDCLCWELDLLKELADLNKKELLKLIDFEGFLPDFQSKKTNIKDNYIDRCKNISKYGYGIYANNRMFCIDENNKIVPVLNPDKIELTDLIGYERERNIIINNTKALLKNKPASNILLTGDSGTGKSSTVKAVANFLWEDGLRIIEVRKDQLNSIPKILGDLSNNPLKFILFIDDLSFFKDDDSFNILKAVLEGSLNGKSKNVVIYATSNRRHIIKENFSDRQGDDIHINDTIEELVSLSQRFGIQVNFSKPNKKTYIDIVNYLVEKSKIDMPKDELNLLAERFALERGSRSPRIARQFVDTLLASQ
ncbi:ATP-binding protein [Anaerococcus sp. AGMB09787]|uniref:ATP-binding protein n=1 Tax=Anaerococcus sp. AGMB09787 TaxID=2922869 RepID=UPI001FAEDF75|nr:ATP-binding protein [Anaerococcus sp. AGMB09787]